MIHEAKGQGATIEEAISNAKAALNAPAGAEVHSEIVVMPTKKVLGLFGGKKAEARAFYETPDEVKPREKQPAAKAPAPEAAQKKPAAKAPASAAAQKAPAARPQKKQEAKPAQKAAPAKSAPEAAEAPRTEITLENKPGAQKAAEYLVKVIKGMGVQSVDVKAFLLEENEILLELDCADDYGIVIGRRGETLDSIQYLARLVAGKNKAENEYSRISVNVGNYREKRKAALCSLAKKNAQKVLKYGRNFTFEPMNPYERRIIHTAIQEVEGVTSYSVGADLSRRVVISLEEGVKPTHPSKGGYNRGRGGRRSSGGPRRNNAAPKSDAVQRAPKTDAGAQGVSLYGKIN